MKAGMIGAGGMRRLLVGVAVLALVGGVAGGAAAKLDGGAKKTLRVGVQGFGDSVSNPALNQSTAGQVLSVAYAPLFHNTPSGGVAPALAVKWHYISGHKRFEFTLRKNARFSDGSQVTAAAVVKWLRYYAGSKNDQAGLLGPKPKFTAKGKWTVRVTLTIPNPDLPLMFSEGAVNWGFVASPKAVANPSLFTKATYGAGPYKLDYAHSVPGDHYVFVPNPYYWDKSAIHFKSIYMKAFADPSTELQALQAGQLDVANGAASTAPVAAKSGFQVITAPNAVEFVQLNPHGSKPLADVRVRQALNYALDRKAISKADQGDYGTPTSEAIITTDADPGLQNYYAYNPTKAKQLLAAAGYPNGFSLTIDTIPAWTTLAGLIAHYLDAVGVKTTINTFQTSGAYFNALFTYKDDAWMLAAGVGGPTPMTYTPFIAPGSLFRPGEPVNPKVDRLYYAGLNTSNEKNSVKYWKEMWSIITTDAWFLPISTIDAIQYASKSVGGVKMSAGRGMALPTEWYFK